MRFQKSQPAGAATLVPPSASTGPLKNMDASSPARKAHAHEIHEKAGSISNTCELPWPVRDVCSTRPLRTVGPEPLHPHVFGPHVALEVGDHLMLFTIRRRSKVSLFLARVERTCTLDRRVSE